jgi:hypothetical protein
VDPTTERRETIDGVEYVVTHATANLRLAAGGGVPGPDGHAKAKASDDYFWQDGTNPDLVWCQFVLDTEGPNKNWDYMPRPVMMKHHATARYKPFDMEHVIKEEASFVYSDRDNPPAKNTIFGVMSQAVLADAGGTPLTDKAVAKLDKSDDAFREPEDRLTVAGWACMWNFLFPKTVTDVIATASDGGMSVSMERWIAKYDFLYMDGDGETLKAVARADAEKSGLADMWSRRNMMNGHPVWRRSLAFTYGGVASTTNPANTMSQFVEQPELAKQVKAAASVDHPVLTKLIDRHNEVHRLWAVATEDQRELLAAEHMLIHKWLSDFGR